MFTRAAHLKKLEREGQLSENWREFLADSVGLRADYRERQMARRAAERIDPDAALRAAQAAEAGIDPEMVPFSIREFRSDLDRFIAGELPTYKILETGRAGPVLRAVGAPDAPITITQGILRKAAAHGINISSLHDLPGQIKLR